MSIATISKPRTDQEIDAIANTTEFCAGLKDAVTEGIAIDGAAGGIQARNEFLAANGITVKEWRGTVKRHTRAENSAATVPQPQPAKPSVTTTTAQPSSGTVTAAPATPAAQPRATSTPTTADKVTTTLSARQRLQQERDRIMAAEGCTRAQAVSKALASDPGLGKALDRETNAKAAAPRKTHDELYAQARQEFRSSRGRRVKISEADEARWLKTRVEVLEGMQG